MITQTFLALVEFGILLILFGLLTMIIGLGSRKKQLFQKLEDVIYQQKHSRHVRIDWLYYLKSMVIPIDQILNSCFKEKFAKNFVQTLYKTHLSKSCVVNEINQPVIKFIN